MTDRKSEMKPGMRKLTHPRPWPGCVGGLVSGAPLSHVLTWMAVSLLWCKSLADLRPDLDEPFWGDGTTIIGTGFDGDGWPTIRPPDTINPDPECWRWLFDQNIEGATEEDCPRFPLHYITFLILDGAVVQGDIVLEGEEPQMIIEAGAQISSTVTFSTGSRPLIHNFGFADLAGTALSGDHPALTNALGATVTGDIFIDGLEARFVNYGSCVVGGTYNVISIGSENCLLLNSGQIGGAGRLLVGPHAPTLVNSGTIDLTADSQGWAGCWLSERNASVLNNGTIVANGSSEYYEEPRAVGVGMYGEDAMVTNRGQIEVTGLLSQGIGIDGNHALMINSPTGVVIAEGDEVGGMSALGHHAVIRNEGVVTVRGAEAEALTVEGTNAWLASQGQITAEGELAGAMVVEGANALLKNEGTLLIHGEGASGMTVEGDDASVENSGTVRTSGFPSAAIWAGGYEAAVDNRGDLEGMDSGSLGIVVQTPRGSAEGRTGGVVRNFGQISSSGSNSIGILAIGDGYKVFNSSGLIETQGPQSPGVALGLESFPFPLLQGGCNDAAAVNLDEILTHGSESAGIAGYGSKLSITNTGRIKTFGFGAAGIELHGETNALEATGGTIETVGSEAAGIHIEGVSGRLNFESVPQGGLQAVVTTSGDNSPAIQLEGSGHEVENNAQLLTQGTNSPGISAIGPGMKIRNWRHSRIHTQGARSSGMLGVSQDPNQDGLSWENMSDIVTEGESSHGMEAYGHGAELTSGRIGTVGPNACGIFWSGDEAHIYMTLFDWIETTGTNAQGICLNGLENSVACSGTIRTYGPGAHAIYVHGQANTVTISEDAQAVVQGAGSAAIVLADPGNRVTNSGLISAPDVAILGSVGDDEVWNGGEITGRIELGPGADELVLHNQGVSQVKAVMDGGEGQDFVMVEVDVAAAEYLEGELLVGFEDFGKTGPGPVELYGTLRAETVEVEAGQLWVIGGLRRGKIECHRLWVTEGVLALDDARVECDHNFTNLDHVCGNGVIQVGGPFGMEIIIQGTLCPGFSIGKLTFRGETTFSGTMEIEIAGPDDYDIVEFDGPVTFLGGQINLHFLEGFVPEEGQKIAFMPATAVEGVSTVQVSTTGLPSELSASLNLTDGSIEIQGSSNAPRFLDPAVLENGQLVLTWEAGPGVQLQQSASLTNPEWTDVAGSEGQSRLEIQASEASRFYRLVRR